MKQLLYGGLVTAIFAALHVLGEPLKQGCTGFVYRGPCDQNITRWWYSSNSHGCYPFLFGGCRPQKNNYRSCRRCMKECSSLSGDDIKEYCKQGR
ncbi:hypothetical protein MTO96_015856 [Rhipicephalus appendiculatus]|uniref:Pancreatic trypsin inhibitor n=1 Tax=Rhipicephalus appendiculatus TaxID=34631 RepID=A0A131YIT0_RHIAP